MRYPRRGDPLLPAGEASGNGEAQVNQVGPEEEATTPKRQANDHPESCPLGYGLRKRSQEEGILSDPRPEVSTPNDGRGARRRLAVLTSAGIRTTLAGLSETIDCELESERRLRHRCPPGRPPTGDVRRDSSALGRDGSTASPRNRSGRPCESASIHAKVERKFSKDFRRLGCRCVVSEGVARIW
jgi:hypothetical protein